MFFRVFSFLCAFTVCLCAQPFTEPLFLNITFPSPSDTVNADRVRISGFTDPLARVSINDKPVSVFSQGSFVSQVNLDEEMNRILVTAQKGDQIVRDILFIYRPPKLTSWPQEPTRIDTALIEPGNDIWLMQGSYITVKFKGSSGGTARFSVERLDNDLPMVELPPKDTGGVRGIYQGMVKLVGELPVNKPLEIKFELQGEDNRKKTIKAPGNLFILSDKQPIIGRVTESTYIHGSAERYLPLFRTPPEVRVHIVGRFNGRFKVQLSVSQIGYIDIEAVKLLPMGSSLPRAEIGAPSITQDSDWLYLNFPIDQPVPAMVRNAQSLPILELLVFGAQQSSFWITYPNTPVGIQSLTMQQIEENLFQSTLQIDASQIWRYNIDYFEQSLQFSIRRPPVINPGNPVQNIVFALDPGHGGEESGAISPLGVMEKDINLLWAESLADLLRSRGARVYLTRRGDETVSLPERIRRAQAANAHIFLSLHNNATTAWGNAVAAQGTSTYFTLAQNKELVWAIYPHMVDLGLAPYGRIYNSYYVTNSTGFLVALIEGGFLTHPTEELKLSDRAFIDRMAKAVYLGVVDFVKNSQ